MSKAPGHQKWPDHQVNEQRLDQKVIVQLNGEVLADSADVIRVDEDGNPPRFYFPRVDVRMERLQPSPTTTDCPFKGAAHYFSLSTGGRQLKDAAWSYEEPYDEHAGLKGRVAFWVEKAPGVEVKVT